jgi:hypothetical protein
VAAVHVRGPRALRVLAGAGARAQLADRGLQPGDVRVVPGAAGGPKGLALNHLDRFVLGEWLLRSRHTVHLIGASIGAWRMAAACMPDPQQALTRLMDDYVAADYTRGRSHRPPAHEVSAQFRATLSAHLESRHQQVLNHPSYRLHVVTSRGRHVLSREGRWRTPLGYGGAALSNLVARQALGHWLQRVVFSDPRDPLPMALDRFPTQRVALSVDNLMPAVLASCSIPFWMQAVHDIPGAPKGAYWDGGITDYHLHWPYNSLSEGLALYPHFQAEVVPGWLDKALKHRHRASAALDKLVVLAPTAQWIAQLPGGKLPDRSDFKAYAHDVAARQAIWRKVVAQSERLAEEFSALVSQDTVLAEPL